MKRTIELYRRNQSLTPEKLEREFYEAKLVDLVNLNQHIDDSRRFTLILWAANDYDIQQVGYMISSSGYTVITNPNQQITPAGILERKASVFHTGIKDKTRQVIEDITRKWQDYRNMHNSIRNAIRGKKK